MTNYLLEKPRVVAPGQDERSFHVFYQVGGAAVIRHAHVMHMACTCRANARVREEYEGMEYELWLYASEYRRLSGFG